MVIDSHYSAYFSHYSIRESKVNTKKVHTTQDPDRYFRTGIAIPVERNVIFMRRLEALNMKTVGELVTMFTLMPESALQVLKPIAAEFQAQLAANKKPTVRGRLELAKELKGLSTEEIQAIIALVKKMQAA